MCCCWRALWRMDQGGTYVPLEDLPKVNADVEFKSVAEMRDDVAMLATWGSDMACRPDQRA